MPDTEAEKTGSELIDEIAETVDLDEFMRRDPATLSDEHIRTISARLRADRAKFIKAREAREEGDDDDDDE